MKGYHDIYITKAGEGYRVRPAVWSSSAANVGRRPPELRLRNLTDKKVLVMLPDILAANQSCQVLLAPKRTTANPGAKDCASVLLKKKARADVPGAYPYSVFVLTDDGPVQASGESDPVVIIDPPPA